VDAPPGAYRDKDPTWEKAVEVLRKKASPGKQATPPGERDD
jgi:hypothetical protein